MRGQYLFPLAHLCHCPPPVVDEMRVTDFAVLIDGIDRHLAELAKAAG
jgi:hypothetical protein